MLGFFCLQAKEQNRIKVEGGVLAAAGRLVAASA